MSTDKPRPNALGEQELDDIFSRARAEVKPMPIGLEERILMDAQHLATRYSAPPRAGVLTSLFAQLGGAPGAAGLALAASIGVTFGYMDMSMLEGAIGMFGLELGAYDVGDFYASFPTIGQEG